MNNPSPPSIPAAHPPVLARDVGLVAAATAVVCSLLFVWSIGAGPNLGDESNHWRRTTVCFEAPLSQMRPTHDPAYPQQGQSAIRYFDSSGWHLALAMLWKAFGRPSFAVAQAYQLFYFFALALFTYLAARQLYGRIGGLWAWALALTMPLNLLLGEVFYMEVPVAAMIAAAVYFIVTRRPILLGLALAGMFYLKLASATVLAPPLVLAALLGMGDTWHERLGRTATALGIAAACFLPDLLWRWEHFGQPLMFNGPPQPFQQHLMAALPPTKQSAIPMYLFDPVIAVQTLGVPGLLALAVALAWSFKAIAASCVRMVQHARSAGLRSALGRGAGLVPADVRVAAIPLAFYAVAFALLMRAAYDARYFHPATVFAFILAGGLLARARLFSRLGRLRWPARAAGALLMIGMVAQAAVVPPYVRPLRTLPIPVVAGFEWIKANTEPQARIIYPEFNLTAMTGRPIMWAAIYPRFLFNKLEEEQGCILYYMRVDYIAIHPSRFIDAAEPDTEPRGYPIPWVRSLRDRPYLAQVYPAEPRRAEEGGEFVIYRVDRDKIPRAWLTNPLFVNDLPDDAAPPPATK
ncbi:MAG: hypothetical protein NT049_13340 [Planctomycetota bacterium]|nr:hypothetical protein [Planctomycetota bacterium]